MKFLRKKNQRVWIIGLVITAVSAIIAFTTLPSYSITWDEPANFYSGRAYLMYYLTFDPQYMDTTKYAYLGKTYVFPSMIGSAVSLIFSEKAQLISYVTAHHAVNVAFGISLVASVYFLAYLITKSTLAASFSSLSIFFFPGIFEQMHNNISDIPVVAMYTLTIALFIYAIKAKSKLFGILTGVAWGIGLLCKANASFVFFILIFWLIISYFRHLQYDKENKLWITPPLRVDFFIAPLIGMIIWYIGTPWLWPDPPRGVVSLVNHFLNVGWGLNVFYFGQFFRAGVNTPWHYPFMSLLLATPPALIILFVIGVSICLLNGRKNKFLYILPLWSILPLMRFFSAKVIMYGGLRHVLEVIPALCITAGIGVWGIYTIIKKSYGNQIAAPLAGLFFAIIIGYQAFIVYKMHPYQSSYFNVLIGGVKGAQNQFDIEFQLATVKQAVEIINTYSGEKKVYMCDSYQIAKFYPQPTIQYVNKPENANYIYIVNNPSWFGEYNNYWLTHASVKQTIMIDGAILGYIYNHKIGEAGMPCPKIGIYPPDNAKT